MPLSELLRAASTEDLRTELEWRAAEESLFGRFVFGHSGACIYISRFAGNHNARVQISIPNQVCDASALRHISVKLDDLADHLDLQEQ